MKDDKIRTISGMLKYMDDDKPPKLDPNGPKEEPAEALTSKVLEKMIADARAIQGRGAEEIKASMPLDAYNKIFGNDDDKENS